MDAQARPVKAYAFEQIPVFALQPEQATAMMRW